MLAVKLRQECHLASISYYVIDTKGIIQSSSRNSVDVFPRSKSVIENSHHVLEIVRYSDYDRFMKEYRTSSLRYLPGFGRGSKRLSRISCTI